MPEKESGEAFCMRVAQGDARLYLSYLDMKLSDVYRIHAHQVRHFRETYRP